MIEAIDNGCKKITLNKATQELIGCQIAIDESYFYVKKTSLLSLFELLNENSELINLKSEITNYPDSELLFCCIKKTEECNEFYICVTKTAEQYLINLIMTENKGKSENIVLELNKADNNDENLNCDSELIASNESLGIPEMHRKLNESFKIKQKSVKPKLSIDCNKYVESLSKKYQIMAVKMHTESEKNSFFLREFESEHIDNISLLLNEKTINTHLQIESDQYVEYQSFIDIQICKEKKVVSLTWHPTIEGVLAASYTKEPYNGIAKMNPNTKIDNVSEMLFGTKPVLIWSFQDFLKPKFLLESYLEVTALSFCPYNDNLLIGGCSNGQINIWDLKDKLSFFHESSKDLINKQLKMKTTLNKFECNGFVKNIYEEFLIQLTAYSLPEKSHSSLVHSIYWIPSNYSITKYGKILENESDELTYQFITSSDDGLILIWELKIPTSLKRNATCTFEKSEKYLHLKKKLIDSLNPNSPYSNLHRIFQPFYTIYVKRNLNNDKEMLQPITAILPISRNVIVCGNTEGDVLLTEFKGHEDNVSKMFATHEDVSILMDEFKHDAPIIAIIACPFREDVYLTIGGHLIALWKQNSTVPVLIYRNNTSIYTTAVWSLYKPTLFYLCTANGFLEVWDIQIQIEKPLETYSISGKILTLISINKNTIAIGDFDGSIRLFHIPKRHMETENDDILWLNEYLQHENDRKSMILNWKSNHVQIEEFIESSNEQSNNTQTKEISVISSKLKSSNMVERKITNNLEEALEQVLFTRKNLKKADLEEKQIPLKNQEYKEQQKKLKIQQKINEKETFYKDLKTSVFPEIVIHEKKFEQGDELCFTEDEKNEVLQEFDTLEQKLSLYDDSLTVNNIVKFSWKNYIEKGRQRRQIIFE